jgi:hypothetical protein
MLRRSSATRVQPVGSEMYEQGADHRYKQENTQEEPHERDPNTDPE